MLVPLVAHSKIYTEASSVMRPLLQNISKFIRMLETQRFITVILNTLYVIYVRIFHNLLENSKTCTYVVMVILLGHYGKSMDYDFCGIIRIERRIYNCVVIVVDVLRLTRIFGRVEWKARVDLIFIERQKGHRSKDRMVKGWTSFETAQITHTLGMEFYRIE